MTRLGSSPVPTSTPSPREAEDGERSHKTTITHPDDGRERTESLEPVQVRRRRRLLRRLALLRLHALPVLLGNAGGDVGLDVDDR